MDYSESLESLNDDSNISVLKGDNVTCVPMVRKEYIAFALIAILEVIFNLIIIAAAIRGRRILRHNYVYAYVTSTLAANVALGFGSALTVLTNYQASENKRVDFTLPEDVAAMKWWAFRKSFTIAVFLIMSASIGAFIYGLRESSYFIVKLPSSVAVTESSLKKKSLISARKRKAIFLILASWLVPCTFSFVPMIFDECLENCQCHPAFYIANLCRTDVNKHCSSTWVPVPKSYLIGVIAAWALLICFVLSLLFSTILTFVKRINPTNRAVNGTEQSANNGFSTFFSCSRYRRNHSITLLLCMTSSYILFTLPTTVVFFIDVISLAEQLLSFGIASFAFILTLAHTFVSPILLVKYLPGLRLAVVDMLSQIGRTSTTAKARPGTSKCERVNENEAETNH